MQYDPVLPDDPKRVLSHNYQVRISSALRVSSSSYSLPHTPHTHASHPHVPPQVAKTRRILTSPALLESTALIFAHGLDLFCTRVAPSGTFDVLSESFNKAQLVVTVAGLAGAIAVVRPIVGRRKLRGRWYN